jgi:hypothetical protein
MGWASTAGRTAAKYGVKYGPHAVAAWRIAGHHVEAAARHKVDEMSARRTAFDHAGAVATGSVLRLVDRGQPVFVVFSGAEPVAAYPEVERPLPELMVTADLTKRVTAQQHHEAQVRSRVRRAGARALRR